MTDVIVSLSEEAKLEIEEMDKLYDKVQGMWVITEKHSKEMRFKTSEFRSTGWNMTNFKSDIFNKGRDFKETKNYRINMIKLILDSFLEIEDEIERYKEEIREYKLSFF